MASAEQPARPMWQVQVATPGGPEALQCVARPWPQPGPGELRVRAEAIGVGRPDVLIREGTYRWMPPLPATPGAELVGRVDALGTGTDAAWLGQRVLVSARELPQRGGGYTEALCVPQAAPFALPEAIGAADAASLPNLQLALAMLGCGGPRPLRRILVPGVAGGVGSALALVARARGIAVIGTARSAHKQAFARQHLGVQQFVAAEPHTLADEVRALTGGEGVDMVFDAQGGDWLAAGLQALAPLGTLLSYNAPQGVPAANPFALMRTLLGRSLGLRCFSMHSWDGWPDDRRALMHQAIALLASGQLRLPPATTLPLAQVQQAHRLLDAGAVSGKLVLLPDAD